MRRFLLSIVLLFLTLTQQATAQDFREWAKLTKESQSFHKQKQTSQAIAASKKALELAERASLDGDKRDNMLVAISLKNLASIYKSEKDYSKAQPISERSLAIFEKIYSQDHPQVAKAVTDLAEIYDAQGMYEQAEPLYKRALEIHQKNGIRENAGYIASIRASLARIYKETNRIQEAKEFEKPL